MLKFTSLPVLTLNGCSNFSTIVIIMKISIPEKSKVEVSDHSDHLEEGGQPKLICNRWSREEFIYQLCFWVIAATSMTILFVLGPMIVLSPETKSINPWSWIYQQRFDDNSDRDATKENFGGDSDILDKISTSLNATNSIQENRTANIEICNCSFTAEELNKAFINSVVQVIRSEKLKFEIKSLNDDDDVDYIYESDPKDGVERTLDSRDSLDPLDSLDYLDSLDSCLTHLKQML